MQTEPTAPNDEIILLSSPEQARSWSRAVRCDGLRIGFVPTMGALHEGHHALILHARSLADRVIVSVFVNPMQFDRRDDFDRYPRPIEADLEQCVALGVDAVYAPTSAAMYPEGFDTRVEPGAVALELEGASRPGHFTGVATVVTKLFNTLRPDVAVFGEKDAQQLAVIAQMTRDLDLGVEIIAHRTVREADGVAMSSRNRRLDPHDRVAAVCIPDALETAAHQHRDSPMTAAEISALVQDRIGSEHRARIEYVAVVDPGTFRALEGPVGRGLILVAVWFGDVRLIDNRLVGD